VVLFSFLLEVVGGSEYSCSSFTSQGYTLVGQGAACNAQQNTMCELPYLCVDQINATSFDIDGGPGNCIRLKTAMPCTDSTECAPLTCISGYCDQLSTTATVSFLGYPCTSNSQCESGSCTNSKCTGKILGAVCNDSKDCAVPLYCSSTGFCSNAIAFQDDCNKENISDWTKIDNTQCNMGRCDISQVPNKCIPIMSKPDGDKCYSSDLCQSGYCDCSTSTCRSASFYNDTTGMACQKDSNCGENFICDDCNNTCQFAAPVNPSCLQAYSGVSTCMQNSNANFIPPFPRAMCEYCTTVNVSGHPHQVCSPMSASVLNLATLSSSCIFDYYPCGTEFYAWLDCQFLFPLSAPVSCNGNSNAGTGNAGTGHVLWAAILIIYCGLVSL